MRKWTSFNLIDNYINDYFNLVYRYYARHHVAITCQYYSFNRKDSVIDEDTLSAGYYNLNDDRYHGCRWDLISGFPLYFTTQNAPVNFTSDDRGFTKSEQTFEVVFPVVFGIYPHTFDFIYIQLRAIDSPFYNHSLFRVTNFSRSNNRFFDFWKLTLYVSDTLKESLDLAVQNRYIFDYGMKYIYLESDHIKLENLLKRMDFQTLMRKFFYSPLGMYKIDS